MIKLSGDIEDPGERVRGVTLSYRTGSEGKFITAAAVYSMGSFRAQIPSNAVKPPFVEYYLLALDKNGLPLMSRGDVPRPFAWSCPRRRAVACSDPWFWVPVGLVVVGGVVTAAILATRKSSASTSNVTVGVHE